MSSLQYHLRSSSSGYDLRLSIQKLAEKLALSQETIYILIIFMALNAFEFFNYGTTEFALTDLLGDLQFAGIRWATILALAFCAIDFAGIARLFSFRSNRHNSFEVWYLLAAWFLSATMNTILSWWSVSLALLSHHGLGIEILQRDGLQSIVPIFVAVLVLLIRILIIGSFTFGHNRSITREETGYVPSTQQSHIRSTNSQTPKPNPDPSLDRPIRPSPKPVPHRAPRQIPQPLYAKPSRRF